MGKVLRKVVVAVVVDSRNKFFFFFLFFFLGERKLQWGRARVREREGERIPSRLRPASTEPTVGLEPTNHEIMT